MPDSASKYPTNVNMIDPILCVTDLDRAVAYYTQVLGFDPPVWQLDDFTAVSLAGNGIYLAKNGQGQPGAWVWVGVGDVRALHALYASRGAIIRKPPTNYPWALEMQVADPDGNVLRFGSDTDATAARSPREFAARIRPGGRSADAKDATVAADATAARIRPLARDGRTKP